MVLNGTVRRSRNGEGCSSGLRVESPGFRRQIQAVAIIRDHRRVLPKAGYIDSDQNNLLH